MSPRAAWRLESIGFIRVYDHVAGKADWGSFGLPLEGHRHSGTRVGAHLQTDVPTCTLDESLRVVCERVRAAGGNTWRATPASSSTRNGSCSAGSAAPHSLATTTRLSKKQ